MSMVQCANGHFYNSAQGSCPHCQGPAAPPSHGKTIPIMSPQPKTDPWQNAGFNQSIPKPNPQLQDITGGKPKPINKTPADEGKTVSLFDKQTGFDPVVGWLVCIEGNNRGEDYRLHSERNSIGRSSNNDVNINGDKSISRDNHASVIYDPKNKEFRLLAGGGRGLVYVNNQVVDYSIPLKNGDLIELGETKLLFIPLCGEKFHW